LIRLGAVSFLNARPLIEGLEGREDVELFYDVPARLPALLDAGRVDAALTPLIDVIRSAGRYRVVSDACIGCDGETMTVRIFSQVSPDRIRTLHVDGDSHTSVALARVLWRELHGRDLELRPLDRSQDVGQLESVLLIGDKVVQRRRGFAYGAAVRVRGVGDEESRMADCEWRMGRSERRRTSGTRSGGRGGRGAKRGQRMFARWRGRGIARDFA
jgi:predicted solute-binding protein